MAFRVILTFVLLQWAVVLSSCSSTPEQLVEKHTRRGDDYMQKEMYREAAIEYKNAVQAGPKNSSLHWKLAKASLDARDIQTAFQELQKTLELDPGNYEALGRLGEIYVAAGKTDEAARIADKFLKDRPQDPQGYLLKGGLFAQGGKIDEAIDALKKAVELGPGKPKTMLAVGNLYLLKQDRKSALEWYDRALSAGPNEAEVHVARGNFFFVSGDRTAGETEFRKAIELNKEKENLRIALAEHYIYQGRLEDSERELQGIIKEMNSQKARKVLAEIKLETGKTEEAKPVVDEILNENKKDLDGKYLKGRIALAEKRLDDAKVLFGEVVKQDSGMARARLYNGLTEILQGRIEVGKKEVLEAVKLDPGNVRARLVLGNLYLNANAPAEAEKEATEVLRRNPSNVLAAVLYGDSFLLRKDWKKAEQVYTALIRQMPESPVGYFKMGLSKKQQKKAAEAADFFSKAVERNRKDMAALNEYVFALVAANQSAKAENILADSREKDPKNAFLWEIEGRVNLSLRRPERAEQAFLRSIELAPDFVRPYFELGALYAAQRKFPEAEAKLRKVIEKNEKDAGAQTLHGLVLNSMGRIDEANRRYRRALELVPRNALAANNLAANLADHGGNLDEALKFAQIAREAAPEDPNIGDTLGWVYYKKGLDDTAYPLIAEASAKLGKNPMVRYHHGMVLLKRGKKKQAAGELKAALALSTSFPGSEETKRTLESLK